MKPIAKSLPRCAFVFDLDGVVIDSRCAVEEAYKMAGVTMPDGVWGKPWTEWCDEEVHNRKNSAYPAALEKYGRPGPLFWVVEKLAGNAMILTGASMSALYIVRRVFNIDFKVIGCESTSQQKVDILKTLSKKQQVVYFDDDPRVIVRVNDECPHVSGIHIESEAYTS